MKTQSIATRHPVTVSVEASVHEAAFLMKVAGVGLLPVVRGRTPIGVITDRDLAVRAAALGWLPSQTGVTQILTPRPVAAQANDPVEAVAELMIRHRVRRLLVLDDRGELAGVVSLSDLASYGATVGLACEVLRGLRTDQEVPPGTSPVEVEFGWRS